MVQSFFGGLWETGHPIGAAVNHLRVLKILDLVSAGLLVLVSLLLLGSVLLSVVLVVMSDPDALVAVIPSVVITAVVMVLVAGELVLALLAARGIEHGRGRVPQTILAVLSLGSIPLGTAFGIYSIWVCWINEETKRVFETGG